MISVVIPTFNECENIDKLLVKISVAFKKTKQNYEIVVIDDHSTDGTWEILEEQKSKLPIKNFKKEGPKGKSFSLMEGFARTSGEKIVMIDADLQYPPEAIVHMVEMLKENDVVIADRKKYKDSLLRKTLSSGFRLLFGKVLFGLKTDVQSGLKAFKREVFETVKFTPKSPWTFDLEFLHRAKEAGFKLNSFNITFSPRKKGSSKMNLIKATKEIGTNALILKTKQTDPLHIVPSGKSSMQGAGVGYKRHKFITHTTLHHQRSALITTTFFQKLVILFALIATAAGIYFSPKQTAIGLVGLITSVYFIDVFFNAFLITKSLKSPPEINFPQEKLNEIDEKKLPIYTILCPLYKEANVLPQFVAAISSLDWPKDKLEVLLLLEEDDITTQDAAKNLYLPPFFKIVTVPASQPKTKPKACNYGLNIAKGKYLVIYDAEDKPDVQQLKKAYLAFKKYGSKIACFQAKLNYYNPNHNLLTRFFTAEYSLWFGLTLTGLQTLNTTIPLGGTSNHFKTGVLKKLEGWDPFNVTEDCDLGVRLFKDGYKTAIIDSTTLEEANSKVGNWIRQRSRWIKGYLQTFLVHNRDLPHFVREQKTHSAIFQLVVGGKIAFIMINPIMWVTTAAYFIFRSTFGPTIEQFFPTPIFYTAVFCLIAGNFLYLYYYMIGVVKQEKFELVKYILFVPIYWAMISCAFWMSAYQLIFKPHYWEKTVHGLHMKPDPRTIALEEEMKEPELILPPVRVLYLLAIFRENTTYVFSKIFKFSYTSLKDLSFNTLNLLKVKTPQFFASADFLSSFKSKESFGIFNKISSINGLGLITQNRTYIGGISLVGAFAIANIFNFTFSAYLGRVLELHDFALVSLIGALFAILSPLSGSLGTTVNHKTALIIAKNGDRPARRFWRIARRKSLIISTLCTLLWIVLTPALTRFFNIDNPYVLILFSPLIFVSLAHAADLGFLSSKLSFGLLAIIAVAEPATKLASSIFLVSIDIKELAYLAIPLSGVIAFLLGWTFVTRQTFNTQTTDKVPEKTQFPSRFFLASLFSGFSSLIFLSFDVVLAKHYLNPTDAGLYALVALIGKIIFFLGSLLVPFIMPLVSRNEGLNKSSKKILNLSLLGTVILIFPAFVALGIFPQYTVPLIFKDKATAAIPYLFPLASSMLCFTISRVYTEYYLAKKYYSFTVLAFVIGLFQLILLSIFHGSVWSFVFVMSSVWTLCLMSTFALHLCARYVKIFENNAIDFIGLFAKLNRPRIERKDKLRILIFNWRDTKHKWAGGAEVYIHELAKRWVRKGNSVTIFCGNGTKGPKNEQIDGIQVFRHGGFYTVYAWAFLYYIFKFRGKYDVIIDSENGIPFFTPLFAKEKKFLLIHHVHQEVFRTKLKFPLVQIGKFLEGKAMPFVYRNTRMVTVSNSSKEDMQKIGLGKKYPIEIVHPGVDLTKFKPAKKTINPSILYLGRLQPYKSLETAIYAVQKVVKSIPSVTFTIAGEGESRIDLEKLVDKLNLQSTIKFLGRVSEETKPQLLAQSWVMVQPSRFEGWGITAIEANASGTPVVASNVPGLRDSVKNPHSGFLVPWGDAEKFAGKIELIIMDRQVRQELELGSSEWAKQFSWEKSAKIFYEMISEDQIEADIPIGALSYARE